MDNSKILVFTDGGARGNPGPAALGVFITDEKGNQLAAIAKQVGEATNNIAEYMAILEAFNWLVDHKKEFHKDLKIYFYVDSLLAYSQITGVYKIKNAKLRELIFEIRVKEASLGNKVYYQHIRRELNKKADALVNLALDNNL